MGTLHSAREAKEFLVNRIVEEAMRKKVALSEIERKMLYFSETDWTLPDINEFDEQFHREYDQDEYERKMARLIASAAERDRKESRERHEAWLDAVALLKKKEDHYILVMIDLAMMNPYGFTEDSALRPRFDQLKLFIAGVLIASVLVGTIFLNGFLADRYGIHLGRYVPSQNTLIAVLVLAVSGAYLVLRLTVGRDQAEKLILRFWSRILGPKHL